MTKMSNKEFWVNYLDNSTLSVLPHDCLRGANNLSAETTHDFEIPFKNLKFKTGLSIFVALIYRLTGDEDIVISTDEYWSNSEFIIRLTLSSELKFSELVSKVEKEYESNLQKIAYNSLDELSEQIKNAKKSDNNPILFRLSYQHHKGTPQLSTSSNSFIRDLTIFANNNKFCIYYNSLLYKCDRITMLGEQFTEFACAVLKDPELEITKVNLITQLQKVVLPDPTVSLDWSGYKGAIQDIFMENAAKHPERPCVIETKSFLDPNSKTRTFTYKQIDQASNIVGNYLKETGIKKGDIVVIYAYRGVDLVIAVMGVLKAGATFSVIDPAYPPARQNIYFSVAKPRGLIGLEKACVLDSLVINYINHELDVISTIPQLKINDDGSLYGGFLEDKSIDILKAYEKFKDQPTGVIVGPDSNPTLSFTSGSEGVPKGVLGRHYSLVYYFPWMAQRFNLSEMDKFTMLSGIAHDPIQRDIFTPLFLGAQLLVPTADDIGTPGKLAEWMATYGATVTHLTPAMGQLLSIQATTPFPALHHAFFVGDILTKKDCLRLQSLAENVFIVNMYGTTETQRSVSYFEIKSRKSDSTFLRNLKDIIPAGKGMNNVQLLIVNRNNRTQICGVGEVGEIYVRAAGLAEGYRDRPDLNKQKFVNNWYVDSKKWIEEDELNKKSSEIWREHGWLGPRDRLYKTGDLGRYSTDGNVECCGRVDDQVKIRGFRIELGEIDIYLSQHPLIRENITLVKRDKNEEPTLVSYIVSKDSEELKTFKSEAVDENISDPIIESLVTYRELIKDIKGYLKTKLASYAIPTIIVPLVKLPLNPNGKVDKPKLPFPDTAQLAAVAKMIINNKVGENNKENFSKLESQIRDLWLEVLPNKPASISKDDSFFDLGGHSILFTRMIFELRRKLCVDVPLGAMFKNPTIETFANAVEKFIKNDDFELADGENILDDKLEDNDYEDIDYAKDADQLSKTELLPQYQSSDFLDFTKVINVFITGATGFLGSFIIHDLLTARGNISVKIHAHVRAPSKAAGLERLYLNSLAYGICLDEFANKIEVVLGDLSKPQFGLDDELWNSLTNSIDVIIHNGALVHWVYPYIKLRDANVISTINVLNMCGKGKTKLFSFVSSTSTIDSDYYVHLSDQLIKTGLPGIPESDDLTGSAKGLVTGYGQSKWAAEYIIRKAGERGLRGCIVRPGYVTGYSKTGSSNTDDFLLRLLKGCAELGAYPNISNNINMVPVDHVARVVVATALNPPNSHSLEVAHVTAHPRIRFNQFLGTLKKYGYDIKDCDYLTWRNLLEKFVVEESKDSALFPLLHFVLDNLPQNTKAPELDDKNAIISLKADSNLTGEDVSKGTGVDSDQTGIYLSYLIKIGFLPKPTLLGSKLPNVEILEETLKLVTSGGGARSSAAK